MAPALSTTIRLRIDRRSSRPSRVSTTLTPTTLPPASVSTLVTVVEVSSWQAPDASARGSMVFCVPFLLSLGQGKPTQEPHSMQAERPARSIVLISSGGVKVPMPSASAPRRRASAVACPRVGGIG